MSVTGEVPTALNPVQEPPEIIPPTPVQAPTQVTAPQALFTMKTSSSSSSLSLLQFCVIHFKSVCVYYYYFFII